MQEDEVEVATPISRADREKWAEVRGREKYHPQEEMIQCEDVDTVQPLASP